MPRVGPVTRIAFAISMLTISLLVAADLLGLLPSRYNTLVEQRQAVAESLAIQFSTLAARQEYAALENTLQGIVTRSPQILSAALKTRTGDVVATFGDHAQLWGDPEGERSTLTHVQVPILRRGEEWGRAEIRFADVAEGGLSALAYQSPLGLFLFMGVSGLLVYMLFLRRALRALDPSSVVPDRVRSAFDLMAEGVVILDEKGQVVLANKAFGEHLGGDPLKLIGSDLSRLPWGHDDPQDALPWEMARREKQRSNGVALRLAPGKERGSTVVFTVNSAPILDNKGRSRGVFVTFDDMTVLEKKNEELCAALDQLTRSKEEILRQNEELHFLATRDPMTGVFNRRALFEQLQQTFDEALAAPHPLCTLMVDIDHFKAVNDTYGHATGDEVIKLVAGILEANTPSPGFVGRYGGEEFAVVLPQTSLDQATVLAEDVRRRILESVRSTELPIRRLTASLGVSLLSELTDSPDSLIDLADQALYQAKARGRNRVVRADQLEDDDLVVSEPAAEQEKTSAAEKLMNRVRELKQLAARRKAALDNELRHDTETGLPNRNLLKERIDELVARQQRQHGYGAVISLEVSSFNSVVKAYGYQSADAFMRKIAEHLRKNLRITDSVVASSDIENPATDFYRISSSELGVLLPDLENRQDVVNVLIRLEQLLASPIQVFDSAFLPQTEMGVALYPLDGEDSETLLRKASAARSSLGTCNAPGLFNFYSEKMNDFTKERLQLESDLQRAIENDELSLWYQPKVSLVTGQICGLEALLRWHHPERGMVPPDQFIPVAEQSDLIRRIGSWVLREALGQLHAWRGTPHQSLQIAVNISPLQFLTKGFVSETIKIAEEAGVDGTRLGVELTEGVLLQDPEYARKAMRELAAHGIRTYLDDFGTGYSSLSYLKTLPINGLKIDRSFIQDIVESRQEQAIVRSIVDMAQGLELDLVAEGIETREQLETMSTLGCTEFQGYYFARPLPIEQILPLLEGESGLEVDQGRVRLRQV